MKCSGVILIFVFALFSFESSAVAAEFGSDSATITNRYCPIKVNSRTMFLGYGDEVGNAQYSDAVGTEIVNSVKCLKANSISTDGGAITFWLAQDTEGNVWALKLFFHSTGDTFYLGDEFTSWLMPATPAVGTHAGLTIPETQVDYCSIVATDVTVPKLNTGLGPFTGCLEVNCRSVDVEVEYYCPGIGNVRNSSIDNPDSGMDLKEIVSADFPGDVNGDGKIGLQEAINALQITAGIKPGG